MRLLQLNLRIYPDAKLLFAYSDDEKDTQAYTGS